MYRIPNSRVESERTYTTSQLADAADVGSQTLRYYERRGLLAEPPRTRGGHRIYGPQHLERLQSIQRIQCLGFQLEEVLELLEVEQHGPAISPESAMTLERYIDKIDEKASGLSMMRAALMELKADAQRELSLEGG